jgi:hypothetical protein
VTSDAPDLALRAGDPQPRARSRLERRLAAATALAAFAVYLRTLAPTISSEDGGELVAAAYTLGIAHPTGYPLWCLPAEAFIELVPFGEVAWRASLLSSQYFFAHDFGVNLLKTNRMRSTSPTRSNPCSRSPTSRWWRECARR